MVVKRRRRLVRGGFTLIELLVALAIVALLLSLALPRYFGSLHSARDTILRENLHQMRDVIDKFHADYNRYPQTLDELVTKRYLRRVPVDPVTESDTTWITVPPVDLQTGGVFDVRSGAPGNAKDGTSYANW